MIRILELLIALVLVVVIFVLVGVALPSHRYVSNTTETSRPQPVVFDMLTGFKRYRDWSALTKQDPKIQFSFSGPDSGKGAHVDYASAIPGIGNGSLQVDEVVPGEKIVYTVSNDDYGTDKTMTFRFKKVGNQKLSVEITESYDVDYGFNLLGRYAGLYVTRSVGDPMKAGLTNLNNLLATIPKFDYTQLVVAPKIVQVPAENLLVAASNAKRSDNVIQSTMETQEKWLRQVIAKNGLEATGPVRIATINFGADNYAFDVDLPVRKVGEVSTAALPTLDVKMVGDEAKWVKYVQTPAVSAVTTVYTGHQAQLPAIREAMKAWAATHAVTVGDRPYDIYTKGVAASFTLDGEFTLYWPLKAAGSK